MAENEIGINFHSLPERDIMAEENPLGGNAGSFQEILSMNLGYYVICEFLVGTQQIVVKQGILYQVGTSYMVLYNRAEETYTICDFYSLKFVTFVPEKTIGTPMMKD